MENLDQEIELKNSELRSKKEELKALKKLNKQIKAFEKLAVKDLQNNLLTDVKSAELDSTSGKVFCVAFKLNDREVVLKVVDDRVIDRAKILGDNWKRIVAERIVDELYKKFSE